MLKWIKSKIEERRNFLAELRAIRQANAKEAADAASKMATGVLCVVFRDNPAQKIDLVAFGRSEDLYDGDFYIRHAENLLREKFVTQAKAISQNGVTIADTHYPPHEVLRVTLENVRVRPKFAA